MKEQAAVELFDRECKKAREAVAKGVKGAVCPLSGSTNCCEQECSIPWFLSWLLGKAVMPKDANPYET